jgi:hypothetical protein
LQITTTPMKYELEIEPAKLELQQDFTPTADITRTPPSIKVQSKITKVSIDTYEARKSLGIQKIGDYIASRAQSGKQHISEKTREYVEIGKEMSNTANGVKISDIFKQKVLQQPTLYTAFLPKGGAELSWSPAELYMENDPGDTQFDWNITDNAMNFIPGSVRMKILEYAQVNIEYLGGPMYVPPSADPDYVGEE